MLDDWYICVITIEKMRCIKWLRERRSKGLDQVRYIKGQDGNFLIKDGERWLYYIKKLLHKRFNEEIFGKSKIK